MRTLFILVLALSSSLASAGEQIQFRVTGVQGKVLFQSDVLFRSASLGFFSDMVLKAAVDKYALTEYKGSYVGVTSINRLGSAMEIASNSVMDAYGWCYKVNGVLMMKGANDYLLSGSEKTIEWFYGYAHYSAGTWTSMCVPADHIPRDNGLNGLR